MSAVHPQHLALQNAEWVEAAVASRMDTDEKRGTFSQTNPKMGPPRICILEVLTLLFFLPSTLPCYQVFPGPDFWLTSHPRSLVTVTATQKVQHIALCPVPDEWNRPSLEAFTASQCLLIQYPLTLPQRHRVYFQRPLVLKKLKHLEPKSRLNKPSVMLA